MVVVEGKTVDNCFCKDKSPKQEAEEARESSDARRLCDGEFSPVGRAEAIAEFQKQMCLEYNNSEV